MARENSVDLSRINGTGAGGRITKQDVEAYIAAADSRRPAAPAPAAPAPPRCRHAAPPRAVSAKTRVEPMSTMRHQDRRAHGDQQAHVGPRHHRSSRRHDQGGQACATRHKDDFQARHGIALTFLPFVVRATVEALRAFPLLNASIDGNNIIYHNEINIGIAVALENGLIVPVIRHADEKNVLGLQRSIVDLAARARSRQLKPDEVQGGTFSITNFGSFGSVMATPVINQPQVAILGVGAVTKDPVVIDDAIAIRSTCYLSLSFDHRLIDGALARSVHGQSEIGPGILVGGGSLTVERLFLEYSINKLEQLHSRIRDCLNKLGEDEIWARGAENENAIGNLVLHLTGNVRQWIVAGVGGEADTRLRDQEFAARGDTHKQELIERLEAAVAQAKTVLGKSAACPPDQPRDHSEVRRDGAGGDLSRRRAFFPAHRADYLRHENADRRRPRVLQAPERGGTRRDHPLKASSLVSIRCSRRQSPARCWQPPRNRVSRANWRGRAPRKSPSCAIAWKSRSPRRR